MVHQGSAEGLDDEVKVLVWVPAELQAKIKSSLDAIKLSNHLAESGVGVFFDFRDPENPKERRAMEKEPAGDADVAIMTDEGLFALSRGFDRAGLPLHRLPPTIVVVKDHAPLLAQELCLGGYPVEGIFTLDPLLTESGGIWTLLDCLRRLLREHLVRVKGERVAYNRMRIGWRCQRTEEDDREPRMITVLGDPCMRRLMSELRFCVRRIDPASLPEPVDQAEAIELFQDLGEVLDDRKTARDKRRDDLENVEARIRKLYSEDGGYRTQHVLLEGETGCGKSFTARLLHGMISRARGAGAEVPWQHLSSVNIPGELLQSELFGRVRGGYTDAVSSPGCILLGRGGVVFIDEIGSISLEAQAKLLTYLDNFRFAPMSWPFRFDLASPAVIVAATNEALPTRIAEGRFREDLYRRFRIRIRIPPLRERPADFRLIVDYCLQDSRINPLERADSERKGEAPARAVKAISLAALHAMERHPFKGNFRELEDVLGRAIQRAIMSKRDTVLREDVEVGP